MPLLITIIIIGRIIIVMAVGLFACLLACPLGAVMSHLLSLPS